MSRAIFPRESTASPPRHIESLFSIYTYRLNEEQEYPMHHADIDHMTRDEIITELATILARGFLRHTRAEKLKEKGKRRAHTQILPSNSPDKPEKRLDCSPMQSVHG